MYPHPKQITRFVSVSKDCDAFFVFQNTDKVNERAWSDSKKAAGKAQAFCEPYAVFIAT
jgi:hypothetical protein